MAFIPYNYSAEGECDISNNKLGSLLLTKIEMKFITNTY
jgi:hypothetical protein